MDGKLDSLSVSSNNVPGDTPAKSNLRPSGSQGNLRPRDLSNNQAAPSSDFRPPLASKQGKVNLLKI